MWPVAVQAGVETSVNDSLKLTRPAPATGSIAGSVTRGGSPGGNGGIVVAVLGTSWAASTADDGSFRIDGVAPATYTLQITAEGYATQLIPGFAVRPATPRGSARSRSGDSPAA